MIDTDARQRLAIAAPVAQLYAVTLLLLFAIDPAALAAPMFAVAIVAPFVLGMWVFAKRSRFSRVVLSFWAPAGEITLVILVMLAVRFAGGLSDVVLALAVAGPLVVLPGLALRYLRGADRRLRARVGVLWLLALIEVAVAIPLSGALGTSAEGMQALAAVVMLLFAPAAALGTWGGLALAALLPEPADAIVVAADDLHIDGGGDDRA
jgi:hypothetical protein